MSTTIEIQTPGHVGGEVWIPGSKSYTNRALLLAALTKGPVSIRRPLESDDVDAMIDCLRALGIVVDVLPGEIIVRGSYEDITDRTYHLHARISGTTIRFLLPLLAFTPGEKYLGGEAGLNKRPIRDLVDALRQLGADITYAEKDGFPPLHIRPSTSIGTVHACAVSGKTSSQYLSALLMCAPLIGGLDLSISGELISEPYVRMTLDTMRAFGVEVTKSGGVYHVPEAAYTATSYTVEGDFSSAGYFFAIAALTRVKITLKNLNPHSAQPDKQLMDVLVKMGSVAAVTNESIVFTGGGVVPTTCDMLEFPDQAQTLGVLAAFASGVTVLNNIQSLRVKETERAAALQAELGKMGIRTESTHDTITIYGGTPHAALIQTYGDHRMAMSFAVAGAKLEHVKIEDHLVVAKTFPGFWDALREIGIAVKEV